MKIFAGIAEHEFVSLEVTFLFPYIHFPVIPYLLQGVTRLVLETWLVLETRLLLKQAT